MKATPNIRKGRRRLTVSQHVLKSRIERGTALLDAFAAVGPDATKLALADLNKKMARLSEPEPLTGFVRQMLVRRALASQTAAEKHGSAAELLVFLKMFEAPRTTKADEWSKFPNTRVIVLDAPRPLGRPLPPGVSVVHSLDATPSVPKALPPGPFPKRLPNWYETVRRRRCS
jgi:hypothetical protein